MELFFSLLTGMKLCMVALYYQPESQIIVNLNSIFDTYLGFKVSCKAHENRAEFVHRYGQTILDVLLRTMTDASQTGQQIHEVGSGTHPNNNERFNTPRRT